LPWLQGAALKKFQLLLKSLAFCDRSASKQKRPITADVLQRIADSTDFASVMQFFYFMLLVVAHDGLLRLGELLSGIRVADIEWIQGRTCFRLALYRTKTVRSGPGVHVTFVDSGTQYSAVRLLAEWFRIQGLWGQPSKLVFPKPLPSSFDWTVTVSAQAVRRALKQSIARAGLPPEYYSGHSLRGGGATDLFNMGTPYPVVKKYGRWTSDVALIY
jgi:hypothetical protein